MNMIVRRKPSVALRAWPALYRPLSLLNEVDELAREFWDSWQPGFYGTNILPHTDMYEEKNELVVKTELPGIDEKDIEITLEGDILTTKAEKKEEVAEDATHHNRERYYGKYFRSILLPFHVEEDKISASLKDGVLELRLPKAKKVKTKKIEVNTQLLPEDRKKRQRKPKKTSP